MRRRGGDRLLWGTAAGLAALAWLGVLLAALLLAGHVLRRTPGGEGWHGAGLLSLCLVYAGWTAASLASTLNLLQRRRDGAGRWGGGGLATEAVDALAAVALWRVPLAATCLVAAVVGSGPWFRLGWLFCCLCLLVSAVASSRLRCPESPGMQTAWFAPVERAAWQAEFGGLQLGLSVMLVLGPFASWVADPAAVPDGLPLSPTLLMTFGVLAMLLARGTAVDPGRRLRVSLRGPVVRRLGETLMVRAIDGEGKAAYRRIPVSQVEGVPRCSDDDKDAWPIELSLAGGGRVPLQCSTPSPAEMDELLAVLATQQADSAPTGAPRLRRWQRILTGLQGMAACVAAAPVLSESLRRAEMPATAGAGALAAACGAALIVGVWLELLLRRVDSSLQDVRRLKGAALQAALPLPLLPVAAWLIEGLAPAVALSCLLAGLVGCGRWLLPRRRP